MELHPFRFLQNLGRSREIATVLLNHGFDDLVDRLHLRRYLQWGKRVLLRKKQPEREKRLLRGERIRLVLENLGATFIKFGQVMSTRPDLIPADVIEELAKLQKMSLHFHRSRQLLRSKVNWVHPSQNFSRHLRWSQWQLVR